MKTNEKTSDLAVLSILKLIKDNSSVSQAKLAEGTGYSRSTISINCEKLIRENLIVANSESTPNKKKNVEFMLNNELGFIIGIGMGGTTCRVGIYNLGCELIEITRNPVDLIRGPEATLNMICQQIDSLLAKYMTASKRLLGIGMGIPSPIKYEEGVAFHPAFMPGWHLFRIKDILQDKYGCPAFIDNEVNTMALEEYTAKRSEKPKSLLCIKIGTGIGAGLIFNGTIYRGENGGGGNLGHILHNPCDLSHHAKDKHGHPEPGTHFCRHVSIITQIIFYCSFIYLFFVIQQYISFYQKRQKLLKPLCLDSKAPLGRKPP